MKVKQIIVIILTVLLLLSGCTHIDKPDTKLGGIQYMTDQTEGSYIANLHEITAITGTLTTERGVWGGNMSRLATTTDGVYTAYLTGGGDGESDIRPFTLYRLSPGADTWEALGNGECCGYTVTTLAGSDGRIYAVTTSRRDDVIVPAVYVYNPDSNSFDVFYDILNPTSYGYLVASAGPEDKLTILLCGGSAPGIFQYFTFDTKDYVFNPAHDINIDYRHCYAYMHITSEGVMELQAQRDIFYNVAGYPEIKEQNFGYIFDGIRYFKINDLNSSETQTDISIHQENPANYQETLKSYPAVINNYTGDACWDFDGRLHVLYTVYAKSNNWNTETWHAVIQDGQLTYNKMLWSGSASLRMVQAKDGCYYLLKMKYNTIILELFRSDAEDGINFTRLGQYDLSACGALQYAGLYIAKPEGGTPADNTVDVLYPARTQGASYTEKWNYFRLYLK
jgi:hypothetical protein